MDAEAPLARATLPLLTALALVAGGAFLFVPTSGIQPHAAPTASSPAPAAPPPVSGWAEGFDGTALDPTTWAVTSEGDFQDRAVDVRDAGKRGAGDRRLRLRAATIGTDDRTVKFLGARLARPVPLRPGTRLAAEIDWNEQVNGCYLSAGLVLSPSATDGNPLTARDWLKVEYVGVPPGRNARLVVARRAAGRDTYLFTEGWPQTNKAGRSIGLQHLELRLHEGGFQVWENGMLVYDSGATRLPFDSAWLYLQMSSHSNYPAREVFFDNVEIRQPTDAPAPK